MNAAFDFKEFFFRLAQVPLLAETDPRLGCIGRTQIIGSLLHDAGITVGRAWILPVYESSSFYAPFYDAAGQPVRLPDAESGKAQPIKWRFHCATCLIDQPGQPVIDFPLFGSPAPLAFWERLFMSAQQRCTPKGQEPTELRIVNHAFPDIPQRQVLRYNPQAQKQNKMLSPLQLAKLVSLPPLEKMANPLSFIRHKAD